MTPSTRMLARGYKMALQSLDKDTDPLIAIDLYLAYLTADLKDKYQSKEEGKIPALSDRIDRCNAVLEIMQESETKLIQDLHDRGFNEFATALQERCYRILVDND